MCTKKSGKGLKDVNPKRVINAGNFKRTQTISGEDMFGGKCAPESVITIEGRQGSKRCPYRKWWTQLTIRCGISQA